MVTHKIAYKSIVNSVYYFFIWWAHFYALVSCVFVIAALPASYYFST